ncbi:MAG: hypothetical protein AABX27_01310 [Nanoarchaeota archaeon]
MANLKGMLVVGGLLAALGSGCDRNYEHNDVRAIEIVKVKLPNLCDELSAPEVISDYWKSNVDKVKCLEEGGSIILTVEKTNPYFF